MRRMILLAVATLVAASAMSPAAHAWKTGTITRTNTSGKQVVLRIPENREECLQNRRALGYNTKTQGGGVCNTLFPKRR